MLRIGIAACLTALIAVFALNGSRAQFNGCPAGFCNTAGAPAVNYTGPLDINGTALAFWSTRCGAKTYSGNVADVWDSATGLTTETVLGCNGSGGVVVKSGAALSLTCAAGCNIKTWYDQSGSNNCSAAACNVTQATNGNRPSVTAVCQNSYICTTYNGSTSCLTVAYGGSQAQPITVSSVQNTTTPGSPVGMFNSGESVIVGSNGANTWLVYAGSEVSATASDSALHAIQTLFNGSLSNAYVDGIGSGSINPGTQALATSLEFGDFVGCPSPALAWTGKIQEFGIWIGDKTANNAAMNTNQHGTMGFNF